MGTSISFDQLALLVFFVALLVATIHSCFLVYHWHAYGEHKRINSSATLIYLVGVCVCFGGMMSALIAIL